MRLIDADALLSERMRSKYYHLPNGDTAVPVIDIEHAPTVGEWISVEDRLPDKQPCEYLVVNGNNVETAICLDNMWITPRRVTKITHWMSLPEPPKEEDT